MRILFSEWLSAADVNIVDILKVITTGTVCITAIVSTGIWGVIAIALVYLIHLGAEV